MAIPHHITALIKKQLESSPLSPEEHTLLTAWFAAENDNAFEESGWYKDFLLYQQFKSDHEKNDNALKHFMQVAGFQHQDLPAAEEQSHNLSQRIAATRSIHFLRRQWFKYAAAIIVAIGIIASIALFSNRQVAHQDVAAKDHPSLPDVAPGTNRAVLTVDDKAIDLSSTKTGIKVDRTIAYMDGQQVSEAGKMLSLTTPHGGQYQLQLPDGTKAWLNAGSSIVFPSAFSKGTRKIKVTGEIFLEVAQDKSKPFIVDIDGKSLVEVLGTSFNINAYRDDGTIKTTLVDGRVKIDERVILQPGQQAKSVVDASVDSGSLKRKVAPAISVVEGVDISQTLAWKEGLFSFNNADIPTVMKQLERWYDITVRYEGKIPGITVEGKMYRNVNLSDVLAFLNESGLHCRLEGKTLVVL